MAFNYKPGRQEINIGEDVEKRALLCTIGGNVNWFGPYGKTVWRFLRKLKIELPYDPGIPLLDI